MTAPTLPATSSIPFRGVIFDLDGTLGDTLPICIAAFHAAVPPYAGRDLTDDEIVATFGPSEEGTVYALAPQNPAACLADYLHHYERLHDRVTAPFPGIRELLDSLKRAGVLTALVTGKGPKTAEISLRRMGLEHEFALVEVGSPHGPRKAEAIRQVVQTWNLPLNSVLYVGDAPSDVTASRKAGVQVAAAAWASTADPQALQAQHPDALFTSVAEFAAWLNLPQSPNA